MKKRLRLKKNIKKKRDCGLMVKYVTFNRYAGGSTPLNLNSHRLIGRPFVFHTIRANSSLAGYIFEGLVS